jgi:CRISPR-associated endonuclease/helicase Cas3
MFINAIYLHDLGKSNPCFQAKKMQNSKFDEYRNCSDSKHSHRGAEQFIEYYKNKLNSIEDDEEYYRLIFILYNFAYHISKHHGRLNKIEDYFAKTRKEQEKHPDFNKSKTEVGQYLAHNFEFYILNKLLFYLLLSSDYYATADYMAKLTIDEFGTFSVKDKQKISEIFYEFKNSIASDDGINNLRNEIFVEANNNLLQNINKQIFYLEAPTGSGKTLISINLALQLLNREDKLNKLFYIFPFNTLVEQTKKVFDDIFKDQVDISVINSITPIQEKNQEDIETNYDQLYINRLFFNSPIVITTHIALFNILFGTTKEDNFPLWQLANSVIILDEIQSYNNQLWWYMVEFFDKYAKYLNIKIIIMSATLPKLDQLLNKQSNNFVDLLKHKRNDFFYNPYFKNRVHIDYSLLAKQTNFDELITILESETQTYQKILRNF